MLQMVVGVCQKKRQCKFNTNPKTFQGDPCPGLKKYIEVAYKCRPCKYSYPYTHTFVRIHARTCASILARSNFAFEGIIFLWDIRFLFMRTSNISLVRRSYKRPDDIDEIPRATRTTDRSETREKFSGATWSGKLHCRWLREYLLRAKMQLLQLFK